jgi:hypothetical protein
MMSLVPNPHSFEPPKKEPFNDPHFRRAIAWAIPYDTLLQVVTRGLAQRLRSCVSLNISGYMEEFWPYETNLEKAREELAQAQVRDGCSVTVPVSAGDAFDEESIVLIKESLAQLGIQLTLQKMSIGQKRTLLVKKQVDMAIYDFRPFVSDVGYYIYWNWLPDSLNNYWGYGNPEAQELGNEVITMAVDSPERHAKLRVCCTCPQTSCASANSHGAMSTARRRSIAASTPITVDRHRVQALFHTAGCCRPSSSVTSTSSSASRLGPSIITARVSPSA